MKGRLLIFCGIPGSGKTTVARPVAESVQDSILIQTEGVRSMLPHPTFSNAESRFVYGACLGVAREALKKGYLVILDGTFMRGEYRTEAKRGLRRHYRKADTVWVDCNLATALTRNGVRPAPVPPEKVKGMYDGFEEPRRAVRINPTRVPADVAARRIAKELML
jgi:predicted kinase